VIGPKAYIDSLELKNNIINIKKSLGERHLMLVVKANGYGHCALKVTNILKSDETLIFCTFSLGEALEIRKSGIQNKILIFSKLQEEWLNLAHKHNIWINASNFSDLIILTKFFKKNKSCPKIHLKFDTGMTRLGFDWNDFQNVFSYIVKNPCLPIDGIYSHFSTADEGDLSFASTQVKRFKTIVKSGKEKGIKFNYIHCSNSGAVLNNYGKEFNTVRVGMLAYGIAPSNEVTMGINVEPVMSFCGPIINLRRVPKNTPISYGGKYLTKKVTNIGVVQMGFADGVPRNWYKNGYVSYNGDHYKIAGRICMDQFMVDFGDAEPELGDEVLVFGKRKNDFISVETIAKKTNTTTYVLLTAINGRTEYITKEE
tara:strand:+ start:3188 stop:4297 length:1110 start_codon:yes stop_codon:yes gene_type:complete